MLLKKFFLYISILLIFSTFYFIYPLLIYSAQITDVTSKVSATISAGSFSLYGYAPSNSIVTISGIGLLDETKAEKGGYFEFKDIYSPIVPGHETCLSAKDTLGRTTNPVCIPPIPANKFTEIGPVLLPPTISLSKTDYFKGDNVTFSGQSIPNSEVSLSMFVDKKNSGFIPVTYAYSIPEVKGATDAKGNYSITMPTSRVENFRVFSQFKINQDFSPNSNIVRIKVLPYWMFIIVFFQYLFEAFKQRLLEIIILSQIIAVGIFITRWKLQPHKIMVQRAIVLRRNYPSSISDLS